MKRPHFLEFIRLLPCLICHSEPVHAAHIRYASYIHGKNTTGMSRKPDDRWCVPLCPAHHTNGPEAQHARGEKLWWEKQGIDPIPIAALLFSHFAADDVEAARAVCLFASLICRGPDVEITAD